MSSLNNQFFTFCKKGSWSHTYITVLGVVVTGAHHVRAGLARQGADEFATLAMFQEFSNRQATPFFSAVLVPTATTMPNHLNGRIHYCTSSSQDNLGWKSKDNVSGWTNNGINSNRTF